MAFIHSFTDERGRTDWEALKAHEVECGDRCAACGVFIATEDLGRQRHCEDCDPEAWVREPSLHAHFARCSECGRLADAYASEDYMASTEQTKVLCCPSMIFAHVTEDGLLESERTKPRWPKKRQEAAEIECADSGGVVAARQM